MDGREIFDTLLFLQSKQHNSNGLSQMIDEYGLADAKEDGGYRISENEIREIYKERVKHITFEDKLRIITQRVYSQLKGFGIIDELLDLSIDGVSGGVSGLPERTEDYDEQMNTAFVSANSGV